MAFVSPLPNRFSSSQKISCADDVLTRPIEFSSPDSTISRSRNASLGFSRNLSSRNGCMVFRYESVQPVFMPAVTPSAERGFVVVENALKERQQREVAKSDGEDVLKPTRKQRLVVLGTGWAALPFVKGIDDSKYEVIMVSPRNYFLFTPLLAGTCVGTLEPRSIIEPIRRYKEKVEFFEAAATSINLKRKLVYCTNERQQHCFAVEYDKLVIAVGVQSSTFGIPGVEEYCLYLKEISHAQAIRQRIIECFESASFPDVTEEDRKRVLHFVIVGGGPTGVEFAAELYDFVREDVKKIFPSLVKDVQITLLQSGSKLLSQFDGILGEYAMKQFQRQGINVKTNSAVVRVTDREVFLKDGTSIPYGLVVWSAGNGPRDLVRDLIQQLGKKLSREGLLQGGKMAVAGSGGKTEGSRLLMDQYLRVKGLPDLFALGDCAIIDGNPLPPTAQVAQQQGEYLAKSLNRLVDNTGAIVEDKNLKSFQYKHLGTLAYVGSNRALADKPLDLPIQLSGFSTWIFWRSVYVSKLFSFRSRFLVFLDWVRAGIFGRDVSAIMSDAYDVDRRSKSFGFRTNIESPPPTEVE
eukprot:CAMPEP_0184651590 /NCGR_PEP_ID=MMETSP0308-20130426/9233_1 /TAXON_ID=38269 /ORGANISM="Gloeochaete witrockiana, Strain SAG 46.84" /LENGTH=578 /DNA_ID=CAMNT_0027085933 /DNA_START=146 /DNA_END=1882 /DNA_ORIENTATION=-